MLEFKRVFFFFFFNTIHQHAKVPTKYHLEKKIIFIDAYKLIKKYH